MRKDALLSLIKKYNRKDAKSNSLLKLLKEFTSKVDIQLLSDDADVLYQDFIVYAKKILANEFVFKQLIYTDIQNNEGEVVKILKKFTAAEKMPLKDFGGFNVLPEEVLDLELSRAMDSKSEALLSQTSTTFYNRSKKLAVWKNKMIDVGCSEAVIKDLQSFGLNINYKKLYEAVMRLSKRNEITVWQLLCLSGDPKALSTSLRLAPKGTIDENGYNILNLAVLSGSVAATEFAMKLGLQDDGKTLILAARSGNVSVLEVAILFSAEDSSIYDLAYENAIKSQNINMIMAIERHAFQFFEKEKLHFDFRRNIWVRTRYDVRRIYDMEILITALITENQSVIDYVMKKVQQSPYFQIEKSLGVSNGYLFQLIQSGSIYAIQYLTDILKVEFIRSYDLEHLKVAVESKNIEMVKWVMSKLSEDYLKKWLPTSTIFRDAMQLNQYDTLRYLIEYCALHAIDLVKVEHTILHDAVITDSPEMVRFIRDELDRNNIHIDINGEYYIYGTVMDHVNNEEIRLALTEPLSKSKLKK